MRSFVTFIGVLLLGLGSFGQVQAHHGAAPHFDSSDIVSLDGTVTQVYFEVGDADGSTAEWHCQLSGASRLQRFGWSPDTLVAGREIRIVGSKARREANSCDTQSTHLANGTDLSHGVHIQGATAQPRFADSGDATSNVGTAHIRDVQLI